jgi:hypothetical protein
LTSLLIAPARRPRKKISTVIEVRFEIAISSDEFIAKMLSDNSSVMGSLWVFPCLMAAAGFIIEPLNER